MGLFGQIKDARGSKGGIYPIPGNYVLEVQYCKMDEDRKKVPFFVAECKILESDVVERRPGTGMSYLVKLNKDMSMGNIADFMRAGMWLYAKAHGIETPETFDDVELDEPTADWIYSEENPFVGLQIGLHAYNKDTQEGNPFTRVKWQAPEEAHGTILLSSAQTTAPAN